MPTLNWIGKEAVVKHHKDVPFRLLEPVQELSCGPADAGNLIVQGDNLHALKALLPRYARAQTVSFTASRIRATYVTYPSPGGNSGQMRGYLVQPTGQGPFPAVLVIHENRGLNPYIEDVARRLAVDAGPSLRSRPCWQLRSRPWCSRSSGYRWLAVRSTRLPRQPLDLGWRSRPSASSLGNPGSVP